MLGPNSFSLLLTEMERGKNNFMIHLHLKASKDMLGHKPISTIDFLKV